MFYFWLSPLQITLKSLTFPEWVIEADFKCLLLSHLDSQLGSWRSKLHSLKAPKSETNPKQNSQTNPNPRQIHGKFIQMVPGHYPSQWPRPHLEAPPMTHVLNNWPPPNGHMVWSLTMLDCLILWHGSRELTLTIIGIKNLRTASTLALTLSSWQTPVAWSVMRKH